MAEGEPRAELPGDEEELDPISAGFRDAVRTFVSDREHYLELIVSTLLAIATLLTTWSAYQSTRWSGDQADLYNDAIKIRTQATRSYAAGMQELAIDSSDFNFWVNAYANRNAELTRFYRDNVMREEFIPFLDAWIATHPLTGGVSPDALRSPFDDPVYLNMLFAESEELELAASDLVVHAQDAANIADEYVLATVYFASVLFFAGISTKFRSVNVQYALVVASILMLIVGTIQLIRI